MRLDIKRECKYWFPKSNRLAYEKLGRLPFDQTFRGEFPEISSGKWYSLFPVWKMIIVRLEFFNDFYV